MPRDTKVYLQDIQRAIAKIRSYVRGMSQEQFAADDKTLDAVIRNLEVIGEAVKQLPTDIRDQAPTIPWTRIAGFRDLLIHQYFGVDVDIVWNILQTKLDELDSAAKNIESSFP